jgi:hypothetical protein
VRSEFLLIVPVNKFRIPERIVLAAPGARSRPFRTTLSNRS